MSNTRKISTKIWVPVRDELNVKVDAACLRRDAYLSRVLRIEVDKLDDEVSIPNSVDASKFISTRLDSLKRELVTLTLDVDVVEHLEDVCARKRIVRDAFFNRLFLLLAASEKLIDRLIFPNFKKWRTEVWSAHNHDDHFFRNGFYPLEQINPFWAIRAGINACRDEDLSDFTEPESGKIIKVSKDPDGNVSPPNNLYTIVLRDKGMRDEKKKDIDLYGLNTYLPDWEVPGHPAERAVRESLDDLLSDL